MLEITSAARSMRNPRFIVQVMLITPHLSIVVHLHVIALRDYRRIYV
jgi:hypothetical protein